VRAGYRGVRGTAQVTVDEAVGRAARARVAVVLVTCVVGPRVSLAVAVSAAVACRHMSGKPEGQEGLSGRSRTPSESAATEPFTIDIADEQIRDLTRRLAATRWPSPAPGPPWEQGTDLAYLQQLVRYWCDGYDWRAQERELNRYAHRCTEIDGVRIHFVHERARSGDGIPLILTHGWPSTFVEYLPLVPLLTDPAAHGGAGPGFDLVLPSLPGYGDRSDRSAGSATGTSRGCGIG
jgi:hypothetical protein